MMLRVVNSLRGPSTAAWRRGLVPRYLGWTAQCMQEANHTPTEGELPGSPHAHHRGRLIDPHTGKPRVGRNWNYDVELAALAERIGFSLIKLPSLKTALRSSAKSADTRLSVLGRSLMMFYIHEHLHFTYPNLEGEMLVDLRKFLTYDHTLAKLSKHLGASDLIQTQRNELNNHIIANTLCGVIGALYQDQGAKSARKFVQDFIFPEMAGSDLHDLIKLQHPRFMLHAILKSQGMAKPESRLLKETGRLTHFPSFVVGVFSDGTLLGEGCGTSLKQAEREAILAALQTRFQTELAKSPLPSDCDDYCPEQQLEVPVKQEMGATSPSD